MSTFRQEFFKAALETPRMFFAPVVGVIEAVAREFGTEDKKKKKKKGEVLVVRVGSYRRMRAAARRAKIQKMVDSAASAKK